jgi:hypothetical protein
MTDPVRDPRHEASHTWLELACSLSGLGCWRADPATGSAWCDDTAARWWGLADASRGDTLGGLLAALQAVDRDRLTTIWERDCAAGAHHPVREREQVLELELEGRRAWRARARWRADPERPGCVLGVIGAADVADAACALTSHNDEQAIALALGMSDVAIWRLDFASGHVQCNDALHRLLGRAPAPGGLHIDEVMQRLHPEDRAAHLALHEVMRSSLAPVDQVLRYVMDDGSVRHVMTRRVAQRDAIGRLSAVVGVSLDVSARLAREQDALEAARRFELVTHSAGIGHWSQSSRHAVPQWSEQLRRLHGLPDGVPAPGLAEWVERFVHPQDRAPLRRSARAWLRGREPAYEAAFRLVRADGTVREVVSHARLEGARQGRLFGIFIDITPLKAAARELQLERERTALAVEAARMGIWEWNPQSGHSRWNEAMWRLRGLAPQGEVLDDQQRLALLHPDDRLRVRQRMRESTQRGEPLDIEFRVIWPDGRVRWLASRSIVLPDDGTQVQRRLGVNWDITEQREAEQALRQAELARHESQAKSRFLARMSHELRTPLNAVLGFAQLLHQEGDAASGEQRRLWTSHIEGAGRHLLTLINDVLDLARLEGGELPLATEPLAIAALLHDTLPLVQAQAEAAGVRLHCAALDLHVRADATRLRQVLLNLLTNAIKYNRPGGEVRVTARAEGGEVLIGVSDSGRGIDAAQLASLFEPFNRLGAEREGIEGTGIGLVIVKSLVERMGGRLRVSSRPGVGSEFEVRLPGTVGAQAQAAAETSHPAGTAEPADAGRRSVLYIEDNPVNALIVQEMLARRPHVELRLAGDGASGLAAVAHQRPHLVLLDMQLPDMDGLEVLSRLRAVPAGRGLPVVAVSANAMPEHIKRALAAGLDDYWTKPLDGAQFLRRLDGLLAALPA